MLKEQASLVWLPVLSYARFVGYCSPEWGFGVSCPLT
jgi:hypothetical protein